jgi:hypothetical protein
MRLARISHLVEAIERRALQSGSPAGSQIANLKWQILEHLKSAICDSSPGEDLLRSYDLASPSRECDRFSLDCEKRRLDSHSINRRARTNPARIPSLAVSFLKAMPLKNAVTAWRR